MSQVWKYPQSSPKFEKAGEYIAWISGSGSRNARSAAAVRVEKASGLEEPHEAVMPSQADSTGPRAYWGAVIHALEVVPEGSFIEFRTIDENTAHGINFDLKAWAQNGWRKQSGTVPANLDALKRIAELLQQRNLTVAATIIKDPQSRDGIIVKGLREKANEERKKPSAQRAA